MAAKGPGRVFPLPDTAPQRLAGGYKNELLRYGDVVLRLEETTLESARWEHAVLRFLSAPVPEVVVPLAGPEPAQDGRVASLLPYVRAYDAMLAFVSDPPRLALGAVHGDVYRGNLRVRDGRIVAVLDWEDARIDWPAWELANATWEMCKAGDALDPGPAEAFLAAYAAAGGPGERGPFAQLLRFRLAADLLYSLTSKARGEAYDPRHVAHLLRALERLES